MNLLKNIKSPLLLGPGPSLVSPNVYNALKTPIISHLDPSFIKIMDNIRLMLKTLFKTKNNFCLAVSGTGSAAMESCFVNLINPGEKILIIQNGYFSIRMEDMCRRLGADIDVLKFQWGKPADSEVVGKHILNHNYDIIAVVHAETSTGVRNPIEKIAKYIDDQTIFIVDAVTSFGTIELCLDKWNIDAVYSCSQKGLSCPPGASPISFSNKAVNKIKSRKNKIPNWYLDMSELINYWEGEKRVYHHTAPINMMYALYQGLLDLVDIGLDNTIERHKKVHKHLEEGLNQMGIKFLVEKEFRLPSLNAVLIPKGINDLRIRKKLLNEFQIEIGAGLGSLENKIWRIGLMGYSAQKKHVDQLLTALKCYIK